MGAEALHERVDSHREPFRMGGEQCMKGLGQLILTERPPLLDVEMRDVLEKRTQQRVRDADPLAGVVIDRKACEESAGDAFKAPGANATVV